MHFQLLPALAVEVVVPDEAVVSVVPLATSVLPDVLSSAEAVSAVSPSDTDRKISAYD